VPKPPAKITAFTNLDENIELFMFNYAKIFESSAKYFCDL
jgi:hypothetical protein